MGCVCGKTIAADDDVTPPAASSTAVSTSERKRLSGPIRPGGPQVVETGRRRQRGRDGARAAVVYTTTSSVINGVGGGVIGIGVSSGTRVSGPLPKAVEGEQVAAGWPPWLATVAGEAIRGWVPRRADSFEKLDKIGQGTYSSVYRARDLDKEKIVALKKVRFDNLEPESVKFMAREILILRRLDHPNIIKLEGLVTSRMSCSLYLVFEYMEHDLAGLASFPGHKFTESQVKCYMQQLLRGLAHCHSRQILHRDIKGSNLLIDNSGILKIADFGLASFYDPEQQYPLTSRVVTLWYRPPELLLGATNYGVAVDLWSTGCILAELYASKPIMPGRTEVEQLHKIFKFCGSPSEEYWRKSKLPNATIFKPQQPYPRLVAETFKDFPSPALALVETLLSIDPTERGTATSALESEFFTTKPYACDPSSLPRYPPSKEFDAKRREEDARRQGTGEIKKLKDPEKRVRESRAVPAPDANAELASSMQKRQSQSNSKSRSEMFNPQMEDVASGFPIEPPRPIPVLEVPEDSLRLYPNRSYYSGPLVNNVNSSRAGGNVNGIPKVSGVDTPSNLAALAPMRPKLKLLDANGQMGTQVEPIAHGHRLSDSVDENSDGRGKYHQVLQQKDEQSSRMDAPVGYGSKGNKIHYSGPLSANVDQMLKDHDRQIPEAIRRTRGDKSRARRAPADVRQFGTRPIDFGAIPVYPSSRGTPTSSSNHRVVQ